MAISPQKSESDIEESSSGQYLLIILSDKEKIFERMITGNGVSIGRLKTNNVQLNDNMVSRCHARIWCEGDNIYIEDLGSKNGTYLEDKNISKAQVKKNQEIRIGSYRLFVVEATKGFVLPFLSNKERKKT